MNIRGRKVNPWKIAVLTWFTLKTLKLTHALIRAHKLKNRKTNKEIINRYSDI